MAVYKDDKTGKWMFRVYVTHPVTHQRVQRKRRGFELRRDAIEAESIFLSEYKTKSIVHTNILMSKAIDQYYIHLENRIKITTLVGYKYQIDKHIRPYFDKIEIRRVTKPLIDNWYETIKETEYSANYKNKLLTRLKGIFNFIFLEYNHRIGFIHNLPQFSKKVTDKKKKVVIFTEEEFNELVDHAKNELETILLNTLFYSGLRLSELRGLRWSDIDLVKKTISVRRQLTSKVPGQPSLITTPKSESSIRVIHIPNTLQSHLVSWKESRSKRKQYNEEWQVFGDYGTVHDNTIRRMLNAATKAAGLPHITIHQLRHSYVTLLYNKGVPVEVIKEQLGHSSIQVTIDTYTHITKAQKQKAIDDAFK